MRLFRWAVEALEDLGDWWWRTYVVEAITYIPGPPTITDSSTAPVLADSTSKPALADSSSYPVIVATS